MAGGRDEGWSFVSQKNRRKRKKERQQKNSVNTEGTDSEESLTPAARQKEEYRVNIKLSQEGASFGEWNPIQLTKSIFKAIGEVKNAKVLRNGSLLIFCRDSVQQGKCIRMNKMDGKQVQCTIPEDRKPTRGVISGIPTAVSVDQIKDNVEGAKVLEARRLKTTRFGEKCDSLSVLIKFDEPRLPNKVYIGYMSYEVRPYIPPPLRCFKCQKYGHVAAVCKGKQRCGRCAGEHEYGKCEEGAKLKCCNCGGEHTSAYRGCEMSKKAAEVQRVKISQGISYAEAVRKIKTTAPTEVPKPVGAEDRNRTCGGCAKLGIKEDTLIVSKNDFVLFMVDVINCSAQATRKTEKIKIIVRAAEKFLGLEGLRWETVEEKLAGEISKSQTWVGGSSWS